MFFESAGCENCQIGCCLTFEGGAECHEEDATEELDRLVRDSSVVFKEIVVCVEHEFSFETQTCHVLAPFRTRGAMAE